MILNHLSQPQQVSKELEQIKKYQKYVNTELDSCFCKLASHYTPVVGQYVPFQKVNGSMEVQDGLVTVKPGQQVSISIGFGYQNTANKNPGNVLMVVTDVTNNVTIGSIEPYRDSGYQYELPFHGVYHWTNESTQACQIGVYVRAIYAQDILHGGYSYLAVQEIGRQITIDPLEHANTSQGIEDAPVGHIISHMGTVAPKHYLICDGAEYNIADYPYLAQHMIDNFGSVNYFGGDGETTFAVPDLRGEFLRGTGTAERATGSGAEVGEHQNPTYAPTINSSGAPDLNFPPIGITITNADTFVGNAVGTRGYSARGGTYADGSTKPRYSARPTNTSVLYCIKYEPTYFMTNYNTNYMQLNQYSEEEQVVGRWIDGKPVYRITVIGTTAAELNAHENVRISQLVNVDALVSMTGYVHGAVNDDKARLPIERSDAITFWLNNGYINNKVGVIGYVSRPYYATVEYTKTTDEPNSFTNDMLQDYVTTEPYADAQVLKAVDALWP